MRLTSCGPGVASPEIAIGRFRRLRSAPVGLGLIRRVKKRPLDVKGRLQVFDVWDSVVR